MDVGILGGTFNPIHLGHLRVAEDVRLALGLDKVIFIPAGSPPHKEARGLAPAIVRLEMVRLAIRDNPYFEASDIEMSRGIPSYSADTLKDARDGIDSDGKLWFLIGSDAFLEIHTWNRFEKIFELADLAVMLRPPMLPDIFPPKKIFHQFEKTENGFIHASGREIRFIPVCKLDISSTAIRRALLEQKSIRYLVPECVFEFLSSSVGQHHQWFQGSNE